MASQTSFLDDDSSDDEIWKPQLKKASPKSTPESSIRIRASQATGSASVTSSANASQANGSASVTSSAKVALSPEQLEEKGKEQITAPVLSWLCYTPTATFLSDRFAVGVVSTLPIQRAKTQNSTPISNCPWTTKSLQARICFSGTV
jgi:hypothetical protein